MSDRERLALVGLVDSIDNLVIRSRFAREVLADPAPPEPAPESEEPPIIGNAYGTYSWRPDPAPEPQCACLDFWTTHHPECPRVLAGLEKAGVAPAPGPEKLRRMAAMLILQPCPHNPGSGTMMGECVNCCARLLERVVRECADAAMEKQDCGDTARDWDRALRVGSQSVLHHFGLSGPSPKSKR